RDPVCRRSRPRASPGGRESVRGTTSELLAHGLHGLLPHALLQPVEVEHAVQVVALVLEAARHELLALDHHRLSLEVRALDAGVPRASGGEPQSGHGQAPFIAVLVLLLGQLDDPWVEDVADLVVDVPGEGTQAHADLVGGETGPSLLVDGVEQIVHERADAVVDVGDLLARCAQHRVADGADVTHGHGVHRSMAATSGEDAVDRLHAVVTGLTPPATGGTAAALSPRRPARPRAAPCRACRHLPAWGECRRVSSPAGTGCRRATGRARPPSATRRSARALAANR